MVWWILTTFMRVPPVERDGTQRVKSSSARVTTEEKMTQSDFSLDLGCCFFEAVKLHVTLNWFSSA